MIALGNPYAPTDGADAPEGERADPTRPGWLSRLLEWQRTTPDPDTFWTSLRDDLAQDREITVFCADAPSGGSTGVTGGAIGLPAGASCVDAAYERHGEAAHCCIGARVNGRLATLSTVLHDGDSLQLLMAPDSAAGPSPEWLDHARTPAARLAIARWLAGPPGPRRAARRPRRNGPARRPPPTARAAGTALRSGPGPRPASRPRRGRSARRGRPAGGLLYPGAAGHRHRIRRTGGTVTVHRALCPVVARMAATGAAAGRGALAGRRPGGPRLPGHPAGRGLQPAAPAGRPHRSHRLPGRRRGVRRRRTPARTAGPPHLHAASAERRRAAVPDAGHAPSARCLRCVARGPRRQAAALRP